MENAVQVLRQNLGAKREWRESSWNPDKIPWTKTEGFKGAYERYPMEGQKPEATSDYKCMLEHLKEHQGRLSRDGFFYWVFSDQVTVGRKRREAKK
jgi:hypothetical protein